MTTANTAYDRDTFFEQLIAKLGLSFTQWRLNFFREWARFEGTGAGYNALATTQPGGMVPLSERAKWGIYPTDPYWNDNGGNPVKNYVSLAAGVLATYQTLTNGYYPKILETLQAQKVYSGTGANVRTWGTMGFADMLDAGGIKDALPVPEAPVQPSDRLAIAEGLIADARSDIFQLFRQVGGDSVADGGAFKKYAVFPDGAVATNEELMRRLISADAQIRNMKVQIERLQGTQ